MAARGYEPLSAPVPGTAAVRRIPLKNSEVAVVLFC
jgi:hypothetical protein